MNSGLALAHFKLRGRRQDAAHADQIPNPWSYRVSHLGFRPGLRVWAFGVLGCGMWDSILGVAGPGDCGDHMVRTRFSGGCFTATVCRVLQHDVGKCLYSGSRIKRGRLGLLLRSLMLEQAFVGGQRVSPRLTRSFRRSIWQYK